jgi:hypothetical protein
MPWRQVCGQAHTREFDSFTVSNQPVRLDRFVGKVVAVGEVSLAATRHQLTIEVAGNNRRAGLALEFSKPAA